jgi:transposase
MKPPLFVRPLSEAERATLRQGLRSPDAFTLRRCQILLPSHRGRPPSQIAAALGCSSQAVRDVRRAFTAAGLACLRQQSPRPKTPHAAGPQERDEDLRALRHPSPRNRGKPTSRWTLKRAAPVCFAKGWTPRLKSGEAMRLVRKRLGVGWKRATHGLVSPDPEYARKKNGATG